MYYPEHYTSTLRWVNEKYPQIVQVHNVVGAAAMVRAVVDGACTWEQFLTAEPSPAQLHKLGTAAVIAHANRGIDVAYEPDRPHRPGPNAPSGRGTSAFGNEFLRLFMSRTHSDITEAVEGYAYGVIPGAGSSEVAAEMLMEPGFRPVERAALYGVLQAGSKALHSQPAIMVGERLKSMLEHLDPAADNYRELRRAAVRAAESILRPMVARAMSDEAAQHPVDTYATTQLTLELWP